MSPTPRGRLRRAAALLVGVLLLVTVAVPAGADETGRADTAADARAQAREAAARVDALQPQVNRALRAYRQALAGLADSVSASVRADADADAATRLAEQRRREVNGRVRALYMSGGSMALYASVLEARTLSDALSRVSYVNRLVDTETAQALATASSSVALHTRAGTLERVADSRVMTAGEVSRRYDELNRLLQASADELTRLSERAKTLEEAEAARARLAALAAAAASASARLAGARASGIPPEYRRLYLAAARTCPGLPWSVLAAIGQVESGHGRNTGPSYAGAQGPMQFMPATFAAYGVDGDHDGDVDINDPADSIFSAAKYLCANGAGRSDNSLSRAIWHYNHADWYVELVLRIAAQIAAAGRRD